ncbi:ABC transporter-like protein [Nitratireductor aquibiodomus RA22]|uniref:Spermidine/putrescine import ATP-binding protein PotA n=1 Tax=Nitratireductor aquibiodomus RA22 TaxID=1189611 RepID=I5BUI6_9HYPH|nr:ABC transporter-like protein [Nitratireductor aquibiodomus RA22]
MGLHDENLRPGARVSAVPVSKIMAEAEPVIQLKGISKHYGSVVGVDHVDLSVRNGEFLTLLGPSGCGKSTLLRMIGGFETPTGGTVHLAGEDITGLPPQRRDVNMMFQDYALFPHMSVGQNIAYGLLMKGIRGTAAQDRVREALRLVGLEDKIDQRPHQLSGGQRQRIALARAIVREPKVLLLDEPLSALDAKLREQMQVELKHMQERLGITFIMVTHDQSEALVMSDRIVVMQAGNIAQDGTPEDLYERPASPYVANFIGTTNFLSAKLLSQEGTLAVVEVAGQKITISNAPVHLNGNTLQIGVRPEKARIVADGSAPGDNLLRGRVKENIYLGLGLRTVTELADGSLISTDTMLPRGIASHKHARPGDEVVISLEPHNIFLFEAGS